MAIVMTWNKYLGIVVEPQYLLYIQINANKKARDAKISATLNMPIFFYSWFCHLFSFSLRISLRKMMIFFSSLLFRFHCYVFFVVVLYFPTFNLPTYPPYFSSKFSLAWVRILLVYLCQHRLDSSVFLVMFMFPVALLVFCILCILLHYCSNMSCILITSGAFWIYY